MDKNGVTAFVNSLLKARGDIHFGTVQNMKFSKETLDARWIVCGVTIRNLKKQKHSWAFWKRIVWDLGSARRYVSMMFTK